MAKDKEEATPLVFGYSFISTTLFLYDGRDKDICRYRPIYQGLHRPVTGDGSWLNMPHGFMNYARYRFHRVDDLLEHLAQQEEVSEESLITAMEILL